MRIAMSAAASPAAIAFIQHLRALGHQVVGIDANADAIEIAQHYCDKCYLAPLATAPDFIDFVCSIETEFDLYLPFIDEELLRFCQLPNEHSLRKKILISQAKSIETCCNKRTFQTHCEQIGLPIAPQTIEPPAIYKPAHGRGGRGIVQLDDPFLITHYLGQQGVIQKRVEGMEYTVDVLVSPTGDWMFGVARKRVLTSGVSTIGVIDCHPAVIALAKQCVDAIPFSYCINIQIILDCNGHAHLIEINPRLAGSALFSMYAGFDILKLSIALFFGSSIELPTIDAIQTKKVIRFWSDYVC